ncbi:MAG: hypothetical protein IT235_07440 [Bacteroidia bacterium]|nr:hypothetical protein [Bacteroidia bacterium]
MNSPFATIFGAILNQIAATTPEIKYISQDFGQLEDYTHGRPAVAFPCALIDFQNWNFENMSDNTQRAEGDVTHSLSVSKVKLQCFPLVF